MERGLELGCLIAIRECQSSQRIFLSSGFAGFPVGSQAQCTGAGRQWGRTSWGNIPGAERRGAGG